MCDRPCESGGSVVHAEDGSTAVLGVLESVQPLRKAGSVGMQRTGLMHVGWWEGVLSVLANIKADYLRRPPSERRQPEIWLKNHLWSADKKYDARTYIHASLDHVGKPAACEGKYAIVCS